MNNRLLLPAALAALAAVIAGCSLAPRYEAPAPRAIATYKEAGDWIGAQPADTTARGPWWRAFGDPVLNDLQERLPAQSPDYRAALARLEQARALAGVSRSALFPTLGVAAAASRQRSSANAPLSAGKSITQDDLSASVGLNWEIDLLGRLRNAAAAAGASAKASEADLAAVELALRAELASDYFSLRGDEAIVKLLDDAVAAYDRAYELVRNRYVSGIAAATDVDQADTLRQNARAQRAAVRLDRSQQEHAIAVLMGQTPAQFELPAAAFTGEPPPLQTVLPSTLLQRRPDVAAAERRMAAANAQVGVARAAWFPVFSLGATAGYESIQSASWFQAPSRFWSLGPSAAVTLLDAGARSAQTRAARAAYEATLANYRKTALVAYREVEDALAALRNLADALADDEAAAASAQRSAAQAVYRYNAGVADYLEVAVTQTAALQAQQAALQVRVQRLNQAIALVRAMGGGWSASSAVAEARP